MVSTRPSQPRNPLYPSRMHIHKRKTSPGKGNLCDDICSWYVSVSSEKTRLRHQNSWKALAFGKVQDVICRRGDPDILTIAPNPSTSWIGANAHYDSTQHANDVFRSSSEPQHHVSLHHHQPFIAKSSQEEGSLTHHHNKPSRSPTCRPAPSPQ